MDDFQYIFNYINIPIYYYYRYKEYCAGVSKHSKELTLIFTETSYYKWMDAGLIDRIYEHCVKYLCTLY